MIPLINQFKIPTLLGLGIIFFGIGAGIFLVLRNQSFISQASPNLTPQNITLTNIEDSSITISWQTQQPVASFITFGQESLKEQTVLDDRDNNSPAGGPKPQTIHYVTLKNLLPKTTYQFQIVTGKIVSDTNKFTTASPLSSQTEFRPIIGSVRSKDKPLDEGIVYLSIADATTQSALIKSSGNFLIPISQIRKADFSDSFPLSDDTTAKLTVISDEGSTSALFKLKTLNEPLPPLILGQNIDLTTEVIPQYDLNADGKSNAADNAIVLQNLGKNPKNKKADLNNDGVVDQKDLDLMSKQINQ